MSSPDRLTVAAARQHACGVPNCGNGIPAETFFCEPHATMLPAPLRYAIRDSYQPGQAPTANRYLSAAIDAIVHLEKRAKTTGGIRQTAQLTLFDV